MIETLDQLDKSLLLYLNGFHASFLDPIMWWISSTVLWIPFYFIVLFILIKSQKPSTTKEWWINLGMVALSISLAILIADQVSSGFFKPFFERLRPSHNPEIRDQVHLLLNENGHIYRGGQFGFVSSHAANSFAIAWFVSRVLKSKPVWWVMISWAAVVSYSRIYLGVHYPGDIIGGAIIGIGAGIIASEVFFKLRSKWIL